MTGGNSMGKMTRRTFLARSALSAAGALPAWAARAEMRQGQGFDPVEFRAMQGVAAMVRASRAT